MIIRQSRINPA